MKVENPQDTREVLVPNENENATVEDYRSTASAVDTSHDRAYYVL